MVIKKENVMKIKDSFKTPWGILKQASSVFAAVGAVTGFLADVLQPIAPFSSYLFFASAIASLCIFITLRVKKALRSKMIPAFMISLSLMVVSGAMYLLQTDETRQSGVLANAIPGIKGLQSSMGLIQKDLSEIKESAKRIEESSVRTEELVKKVEQNTEENVEETRKVAEAVRESTQSIVGSLQDIQKGFTTLTQSGGVIANPKRPEQFYHNARVQELGGDYGNAQRSYNRYFTFHLDYIDPHLRYQKYLKVQEGREGAREVYFEMKEDSKSFVTEYASILLFSRKTRVKKLEKFMEKHPEFGPGYFELSKEFSEARLGEQTQEDKGNEKKYLKKFYELHEQGKVLKYFMDKDMVSKFLNNAEKRMTALKFFDASILENPVQLEVIGYMKRTGFDLRLSSIDEVQEYFVRFEGETEFTGLGHWVGVGLNKKTGKPYAQEVLKAPANIKKGKIHVKYLNLKSEMHGPYEFDVDPEKWLADSHMLMAKMWGFEDKVEFNSSESVYLKFFQFVCGLEKVKYSFNDQNNLDQEIPIPKCNGVGSAMLGGPDLSKGEFKFPPGSPFEVGFGGYTVTWDIPLKPQVIYFQFFYKDGTKSKIESLLSSAFQEKQQHDSKERMRACRQFGGTESACKKQEQLIVQFNARQKERAKIIKEEGTSGLQERNLRKQALAREKAREDFFGKLRKQGISESNIKKMMTGTSG